LGATFVNSRRSFGFAKMLLCTDWNFKNDQYTLKSKDNMNGTIELRSASNYRNNKEKAEKGAQEGL
jgi:hypothetical protein